MEPDRLKLLEMMLSEIRLQYGRAVVRLTFRAGQVEKWEVLSQAPEGTLTDVKRVGKSVIT